MNNITIITVGSPETTDYDHICHHLDALLVNAKDKKVTIFVPRMGGVAEPLFLLYATERNYDSDSANLQADEMPEVFNKFKTSEELDRNVMVGYVGFGDSELVKDTYHIAQQLNIKARKINA